VGGVDRDDADGCRSRGGSPLAMSDNNFTLSSLGVALNQVTQMGDAVCIYICATIRGVVGYMYEPRGNTSLHMTPYDTHMYAGMKRSVWTEERYFLRVLLGILNRAKQSSLAGAYSAGSETVRGKHSRRGGYSAEPLLTLPTSSDC
jgi:hypothetical protein